jgi:SulP family sulfate permease
LEAAIAALPSVTYLRPCTALKEAWKQGYHGSDFRSDLMAGLVVGVIALPLSMALAIASGVPPQHGLYTAIIGGGLIALLGGSRVQVSGPTAAFVVILAPISAKFGLAGLALASVMAGFILMAMGFFRLGRLIEFIPNPVTTGFTAGIAVVIATLQIKDFLGLSVTFDSDHYVDRVAALVRALPTLRLPDLAIGTLTLAILVVWGKYIKKVPAALVGLTVAAVTAWLLTRYVDGFEVATIRSRFGGTTANPHGIPSAPPMPMLPWQLSGPGGGAPLPLSIDLLQELLPAAFAIAMLGAIESLLSAVVADGMSGHKHDPDAELMAQGTGNVIAPFFGGFAATGAIARTAANIRSGGRSPIAAVAHAIFIFAAVLALAPLLGHLPMASMAALLLVVAWNMSEARHFAHTLSIAPRSDVVVLVACFVLTVIFDMTVAVSAGVVLAAILFMRRMAEFSGARLIGEHHPSLSAPLPARLMIYEVAGPLFFGAAQKAMSQLGAVDRKVKIVVFDLTAVPVMDATGLVSLDSAVDRLYRQGVYVVLAGVQPQPGQVLAKAGWENKDGRVGMFHSFNQGLAAALALEQLMDHEPDLKLVNA